MGELPVILGTAVTLATFMGGAGLFILRLVIDRDVRPIGDTMIGLRGSLDSLKETLMQQRIDATRQRDELHDAIEAIREMLSHHQAQLGLHETRITVLEQPPRATKIRSRS